MRSPRAVRLLPTAGLLLVFAFTRLAATASAADPVEDLAQALRVMPDLQDKDQMKAYQKRLKERAEAVKRPADLRRALALPELSSNPQQFNAPPEEEDPFVKVFPLIRSDLTKRLTGILQDGLKANDPGRRLAAITFLTLLAGDEDRQGLRVFRGPAEARPARFTASLTGDLLTVLAEDQDSQVRAAAIEAVAVIDPGSERSLAALKGLLKPQRPAVERRAAAEAVAKMLQVLGPSLEEQPEAAGPGAGPQPRLKRGFQPPPGALPVAPPSQSFGNKALADIVRLAGLGLDDKDDATVRRLCLETMAKAVQQGSKQDTLAQPLAVSVNEQTPAVIGLLADGDLQVCLAAHHVLEVVASARRRLHGPEARPQLLDGVLKAVPALTQSLAPQKEVRVRLAALYVLETLDEQAAEAVEAVAEALSDKKNGYVRWGAARVLKNMAPQAANKAVSALTRALGAEDNKTVRLTLVTALERYGPKAASAVEALGKAVADSEPRIRTEAIHALSAIGDKARSQEGLLVKALKDDQTPAVRVAAAEALGRWPPLSADGAKALRDALRDADAEVRRAASDALLNAPGKPAGDVPPP